MRSMPPSLPPAASSVPSALNASTRASLAATGLPSNAGPPFDNANRDARRLDLAS